MLESVKISVDYDRKFIALNVVKFVLPQFSLDFHDVNHAFDGATQLEFFDVRLESLIFNQTSVHFCVWLVSVPAGSGQIHFRLQVN